MFFNSTTLLILSYYRVKINIYIAQRNIGTFVGNVVFPAVSQKKATTFRLPPKTSEYYSLLFFDFLHCQSTCAESENCQTENHPDRITGLRRALAVTAAGA